VAAEPIEDGCGGGVVGNVIMGKCANVRRQNFKINKIDKMKVIIHFIQSMVIVLFFTMMVSGCKKFVEIDEPIDKITTTNVFSNDQSATSAVLGVYSQMMTTLPYIVSGGTTINAGMSADELTFTGTTADALSINSNTIVPTNGVMSLDLWQRAYFHVYHVNACLEGLNESTEVSIAAKKQLTGELKFLRAYIFYYLVNFFGDVPMPLTTVYGENALMPRTAEMDIYEQIVKDLAEAKQLLPVVYPSAGKGRVNRWAASALLARVYLHQRKWMEAEMESNAVISSGSYTMVSNLNNVFIANSTEAIWQLVPVVAGFNTTEAARLIPASATTKPTYVLATGLLNAFEAGDQRKSAWTAFNTISSVQYYYPNKYKVRMNTTVTEYYMMLRLAEQYLIRAEARAQQDKLTEAKADIGVIRARAGLANTTAVTKAALLNAIEQERRIELFAEWGHRWFDLKRTERTDAVMSVVKTGWQSYMSLYPIPQGQMNLNPLLRQNAGY
jgi:starch-binding outer membrane protein, SusD/RagB family